MKKHKIERNDVKGYYKIVRYEKILAEKIENDVRIVWTSGR